MESRRPTKAWLRNHGYESMAGPKVGKDIGAKTKVSVKGLGLARPSNPQGQAAVTKASYERPRSARPLDLPLTLLTPPIGQRQEPCRRPGWPISPNLTVTTPHWLLKPKVLRRRRIIGPVFRTSICLKLHPLTPVSLNTGKQGYHQHQWLKHNRI